MPFPVRRVLTPAIAAAVLVASLATPAVAQPSPVTPAGDSSSLRWSACADDPSQQCTRIRVPFTWGQRSGPYFSLSMRKLPALPGSTRVRTLFINPGGPGVPGTGMLGTFAGMTELRRHFDIVGWDPRGVGDSAPLPADCPISPIWGSLPASGPFTWTAVAGNAIGAMSRQAATCWNRNAALRTHLGTQQVIRDLEAMRIAVGAPTLNFIGYSYGTTIGRSYAAHYPDRVGVMLLDGVTSPVPTMQEALQAAQTGGTAAWRHARSLLDPDIRVLHAAVSASLNANGSPEPDFVTRWTFWNATLSMTGAPDPRSGITSLTCSMAEFLDLPRAACSRLVPTATVTSFDASPASYLVDCADRSGRLTAAQIGSSIRANRTGPEAAVNAVFFSTYCSGMPPAWDPLPRVTSVRLRTPPLIMNGLYDRRTPMVSARKTATAMKGARIVAVSTGVHGLYAFHGGPQACHNRVATSYLVTGRLPARDVLCPTLD